jgi:hypothetical protein
LERCRNPSTQLQRCDSRETSSTFAKVDVGAVPADATPCVLRCRHRVCAARHESAALPTTGSPSHAGGSPGHGQGAAYGITAPVPDPTRAVRCVPRLTQSARLAGSALAVIRSVRRVRRFLRGARLRADAGARSVANTQKYGGPHPGLQGVDWVFGHYGVTVTAAQGDVYRSLVLVFILRVLTLR